MRPLRYTMPSKETERCKEGTPPQRDKIDTSYGGMDMKKTVIIVGGMATALIAASAFAAPFDKPQHGKPERKGGAPKFEQHKGRPGIPDNAPEEIKTLFKEFASLNHDLNLELNKDNPDSAKALEMVEKAEAIHAKLRQWKVQQILDGNLPKPDLAPKGGKKPMDGMDKPADKPMMDKPMDKPMGKAPARGEFGAPRPDGMGRPDGCPTPPAFRGCGAPVPPPCGPAPKDGFRGCAPKFDGHAPEFGAPKFGGRVPEFGAPQFGGRAPEFGAPKFGDHAPEAAPEAAEGAEAPETPENPDAGIMTLEELHDDKPSE